MEKLLTIGGSIGLAINSEYIKRRGSNGLKRAFGLPEQSYECSKCKRARRCGGVRFEVVWYEEEKSKVTSNSIYPRAENIVGTATSYVVVLPVLTAR